MNEVVQTLASVVKIALKSRRCCRFPQVHGSHELVVLGNGPSLNDTIVQSREFLQSRDLLAVNFAANAPVFPDLRPRYYVLADPHFFVALDQPNVKALWHTFAHEVDWDMTLFIPAYAHGGAWLDALKANPKVRLVRYNTTPVEGLPCFTRLIYKAGLGMPRPRNVLIPSIMIGIGMSYKTIYLAGADHSWTKTLGVDDENHVVAILSHFYKEGENEQQRVKVDYMHYPLHQIMYSFYVAFKSYFSIKSYAEYRGVSIYNITPGSFIDAFPRKKV